MASLRDILFHIITCVVILFSVPVVSAVDQSLKVSLEKLIKATEMGKTLGPSKLAGFFLDMELDSIKELEIFDKETVKDQPGFKDIQSYKIDLLLSQMKAILPSQVKDTSDSTTQTTPATTTSTATTTAPTAATTTATTTAKPEAEGNGALQVIIYLVCGAVIAGIAGIGYHYRQKIRSYLCDEAGYKKVSQGDEKPEKGKKTKPPKDPHYIY